MTSNHTIFKWKWRSLNEMILHVQLHVKLHFIKGHSYQLTFDLQWIRWAEFTLELLFENKKRSSKFIFQLNFHRFSSAFLKLKKNWLHSKKALSFKTWNFDQNAELSISTSHSIKNYTFWNKKYLEFSSGGTSMFRLDKQICNSRKLDRWSWFSSTNNEIPNIHEMRS